MNRFLKGLGIVLGLMAVGVLSAVTVISLLLRQEEVKVPDLSGKDIVTAIETLTQQGLQLKVERREPHSAVPRDAVISQTPPPGSGMKKGRPVRVVVSLGPSEMQTPNLGGEQYRKADLMIRQAGFIPGGVSRVSSDVIQRDTVIAQDPPAGTPLEKGGAVSLLVSAGKRTERYVMPALTGKKAEEAVRILDAMGLQHRLTYKASGSASAAASRMVVSQKPAAGYPVTADAGVELVVSK